MLLFVKFASWAVILYIVYCTALFLVQRQVLFPRHLAAPPTHSADDALPGVEKIWLDMSFGRVESWLVPASAASAPAVIFAHGNAELIDFCLQELRMLTHLGLNVLLVEYPGYGRSGGKPSQHTITETFEKAYDVLVDREEVDASRIVFYGRSLGGGAVCALALKRSCSALILLSTFTSVRSFAKSYLAPGFLIRDPFDNLAAVAAYAGPVLVLHGKNDEVIPYRHGLAIHQACRRAKLISYACGHNDCPPSRERFAADVETFLKESGVLSS